MSEITKEDLIKKADKIIKKNKLEAIKKGVVENQGEKDYRNFHDIVEASNLSYGEKAEVENYLFKALMNLDDRNKFN